MNPIHARYQTALRPDIHNRIYYSKQKWFCKAISLKSLPFDDDVWQYVLYKNGKKIVDSLPMLCYSDMCTIMDKIAFYAFRIEDNGVCQ